MGSHQAEPRGGDATVAEGLGKFAAHRGWGKLANRGRGIDAPAIRGSRDGFEFFDLQGLESASGKRTTIEFALIEFAAGVVEFCRGLFFGDDLGRVVLNGERDGDVDIFKNLPGRDADDAVGGFDEVVSLAATVLASEIVDEAESGTELLGLDQEARAVRFPFLRFHSAMLASDLVTKR